MNSWRGGPTNFASRPSEPSPPVRLSTGSFSVSGEAAEMPFPIHPHMLRHACGFQLANDGHARPAALPRAQEHPAHRQVLRLGARPVQGLLEGLTVANPASVRGVPRVVRCVRSLARHLPTCSARPPG